MSAICGGECDPLKGEQSPWETPRNILFAAQEGACGALGSLVYDPISNKLGELPCIIDSDATNGCVHQRRIVCSAGSTQLSLGMEVAFRPKRGWRGRATVELDGDTMCEGTYSIAL